MRVHGLDKAAIALALLALAACGKPDGYGPEHEPSGQSRITFEDGMAYADYIAATRERLIAMTADLPAPPDDSALGMALPREIVPDEAHCAPTRDGRYERGVLLIHGLYDSPFLMSDMAEVFAENCYLVRILLLPGHGSRPGDLLTVRLEEWRDAVAYGVSSFAGQIHGDLTVAGYSTGAGLAILHALGQEENAAVKVGAVVGMAPGASGALPFGGGRRLLARLAIALPRGRYTQIAPEHDPAKYEAFSIPAALEYLRLQDAIGDSEEGPSLTVPTVFAMSAVDQVVPAEKVLSFFCNRVDAARLFILYSSTGADTAPCAGVEIRAGAYPEIGFLDMSHLGITMAPDNPHYGDVPGAYYHCLDYLLLADDDGWATCRDPSKTLQNANIRYGINSRERREDHVIRRSTFNPDFYRMMASILLFLEQTDS